MPLGDHHLVAPGRGLKTSMRTRTRTAVQTRKAVVEKLAARAGKPQAAADEALESPLYGVAMLRMALELKREDAGSFEEILTRVLSRMKLDEAPFRRYLEKNGGLLQSLRRA